MAKPLGKGEKIVDPLFFDYDRRDLHLSPGSPAVDAGVIVDTQLDFDGKPVPAGRAPDIGAYEYQSY